MIEASRFYTRRKQVQEESSSTKHTIDQFSRSLAEGIPSNQTTNGVSAQRRFAYDRYGNRTGMWDAVSGGSQIQSVTLDQPGGTTTNRIQSVTSGGSTKNYTYDAAGNVIDDGTNSYTYNGDNQLSAVNWGQSHGYTYAFDPQNRRIKRANYGTGAWTHTVWDGSQVIAEYNQSGGLEASYYYSRGRLIRKDVGGAGTRTYLSDRLSIRLSLDTNGNVVGRQGHLPYGEEIGTSGELNKNIFTSYERDTESGLDYAINRGYSPGIGRFQQPDPYRASGEAAGPQKWNRYSYTANDPINKIDRLGLFAEMPVCDEFDPFADQFFERILKGILRTLKKVARIALLIIKVIGAVSFVDLIRNFPDFIEFLKVLFNRTPCNAPDFVGLSPGKQQELSQLGVTADRWNGLNNNQRLGFFNIVAGIRKAGLSLDGWVVDWRPGLGIRQDRVFFIFTGNGIPNLRDQVKSSGMFSPDINGGREHPGYEDSYRQDVFFRSLQMSFSPDGTMLEADIDIFNPNSPVPSVVLGALLHVVETVFGGTTSPYNVAHRDSWECQ